MEVRTMLDPKAAAALLGVAAQTLARWRCEGGGPRYMKVGGVVRYDVVELDHWLAARMRRSTSDHPEVAA